MRGRRSTVPVRSAQGGYLLIALAGLLVVFALTWLAMLTQSIFAYEAGPGRSLAEAGLDAASRSVEAFYQANVASMDAQAAAPWGEAELLRASGVADAGRLGLRLTIGSRQTSPDGAIAWRNLYLWLPPRESADATAYDPLTDTFTADAQARWRQVDGRRIQSQAFLRTTDRLRRVVTALGAYYQARLRTDPAGQSPNYWMTAPCVGNPASAAIGAGIRCSVGYEPLTALAIPEVAGVSGIDLVDAWDRPFELSNTTDAQVTAPPYTAVLRFVTPWGAVLRRSVAQAN